MLGNLAAWITGALENAFDISDNSYTDDDEGLVDLQCGRTVFNDVPAKMRTELWASQLHKVNGAGAAAVKSYSELARTRLNPDVVAEIQKDTHRTFPGHRWLSGRAGQLAMLRVLCAYAALDPEVGYTQGMNFLAGLLLAYLDEPQAFGALVLIMQDRGLRDLYRPDDGMAFLQVRLWQLGRLLPPQLALHLESHAALPVLYASSWFLTCFAADFPLHFAARVMDLVMTGAYAAPLMKVAVHVVERCQSDLLQLEDLEDMVDLLRKEVPKWSRNKLQDLLTEALGRGWTERQAAVLREMNGAESVADAVARVDAALHAAGAAGGESEGAETSVQGRMSERRTSGFSIDGPMGSTTTISSLGSPKTSAVTYRPSSANTESSTQQPGKLLPLPPPPTSKRDKVDWTKQWRPSAPLLKSLPSESMKIQDFQEPSLDPGLSRELSCYLKDQGSAAVCHVPGTGDEKKVKEETLETENVHKGVSTENDSTSADMNASPGQESAHQLARIAEESGGDQFSLSLKLSSLTTAEPESPFSPFGGNPSPFQSAGVTGSNTSNRIDTAQSLEFSEFTAAAEEPDASPKKARQSGESGGAAAAGGETGIAGSSGLDSWGISGNTSVTQLLADLNISPEASARGPVYYKTLPAYSAATSAFSSEASRKESMKHPGHTRNISQLSGFGSWRAANDPGMAEMPTKTTATTTTEMSPASSRAQMLAQAHLREFDMAAKRQSSKDEGV